MDPYGNSPTFEALFSTQQDDDLKVAAVAALGKARRLLPFIRKVRCSASV